MAEETTNESCNAAIKKRISRKRPATEQTPGTPAATQHIAPEPDAATEHIAPASLGSTCEASPGSGDMTIESLADVVSKLASECDESAVALRGAARTLQRGVRDEVRNLCKPWGVQMGNKIDGKYQRRDDGVLRSELTATVIEKAREHLRTKATEVSAGSAPTTYTETEFDIDERLAETLGSLQAIDTQEPILIRVIDHACSSEHCVSYELSLCCD